MKIHLRFDLAKSNSVHTRMSIFVDGKLTGQLCMSPDEADWFYLVVERGCREFSTARQTPIEFLGSGSHRPDEPIPPVPP